MEVFVPKNALYILNKIQEANFEAYIVGGFVRDTLLNKESFDIDIATNANPNQIETIFKDHKQSAVGKRHGTIGVLYHDEWFEITSFRSDVEYSDYRRPDKVHFVSSLNEDLVRRDFTINALALNSKGIIIDCVNGQNDIKQRLIRSVGEATKRFNEDALRMIRALRFAAQLDFSIEEKTAEAIHQHAPLLVHIAIERIAMEFDKLLRSDRCASILMDFKEVIGLFLPEILFLNEDEIKLIDQCKSINQKYLLLFSRSSTEQIKDRLKKLRQSNLLIQTIVLERELFDEKKKSEYDLRRLCHKAEISQIRDSLSVQYLLNKCDNAIEKIKRCEEIFDQDICVNLKQLDIKGHDLFDLGLRGKQISDMLDLILDEVMRDRLKNEKDEILTFVLTS